MDSLSDFTIIRKSDDLIEIKSRHHYWRMTHVPNTGTYLLAHKHNQNDTYHKQRVCPSNPTTLRNIIKHIKEHDSYVDSLSTQ